MKGYYWAFIFICVLCVLSCSPRKPQIDGCTDRQRAEINKIVESNSDLCGIWVIFGCLNDKGNDGEEPYKYFRETLCLKDSLAYYCYEESDCDFEEGDYCEQVDAFLDGKLKGYPYSAEDGKSIILFKDINGKPLSRNGSQGIETDWYRQNDELITDIDCERNYKVNVYDRAVTNYYKGEYVFHDGYANYYDEESQKYGLADYYLDSRLDPEWDSIGVVQNGIVDLYVDNKVKYYSLVYDRFLSYDLAGCWEGELESFIISKDLSSIKFYDERQEKFIEYSLSIKPMPASIEVYVDGKFYDRIMVNEQGNYAMYTMKEKVSNTSKFYISELVNRYLAVFSSNKRKKYILLRVDEDGHIESMKVPVRSDGYWYYNDLEIGNIGYYSEDSLGITVQGNSLSFDCQDESSISFKDFKLRNNSVSKSYFDHSAVINDDESTPEYYSLMDTIPNNVYYALVNWDKVSAQKDSISDVENRRYEREKRNAAIHQQYIDQFYGVQNAIIENTQRLRNSGDPSERDAASRNIDLINAAAEQAQKRMYGH